MMIARHCPNCYPKHEDRMTGARVMHYFAQNAASIPRKRVP